MMPIEEVRLAVSPNVLARLLAHRQLCVDDFRCLDGTTKGRVKAILLDNLRGSARARRYGLCPAGPEHIQHSESPE